MSQAQIETFKIQAVNSVLLTLGDSMFSILRENLARNYRIHLETDSFSLYELHDAMTKLLGTNGAHLLTREIRNEMVRLNDSIANQ
jgi:hypothetical protein